MNTNENLSSKLRCAVIIPIGPGHEEHAKEAKASVQASLKTSVGPFTNVSILSMPDPEGTEGISKRRNEGIELALSQDFDWIFFLDADDLMAPTAFAAVAPYVDDYDAVFGMIAETMFAGLGLAKHRVTLRPKQLGQTSSLQDILQTDPFLTLQMGHFVRTKCAAEVRFDTEMDIGEDFKYYLKLWKLFRCTKIHDVLFVNRRGSPSSGPRSGDGARWRKVVMELLRSSPDHLQVNE